MSSTIAILSDTHDNLANLNQTLDILHQKEILTVIHCGDLTNPDTAWHFYGFRVIHATGNGDRLSREIQAILQEMNPGSFSGPVYEGEIDRIKFAVTHGHILGKVESLAQSGQFKYVFHGHTHRRRQETIGNCMVINPGALGGLKRESHSFALLDLATSQLTIEELS